MAYASTSKKRKKSNPLADENGFHLMSEWQEPPRDDDLTLYDVHRQPRPLLTGRRRCSIKALRSEFQCVICLNYITNARVVLECLHRFCDVCIDKTLRMCRKECPICRVFIPSRRSLVADPNFDRLVAAVLSTVAENEDEPEPQIRPVEPIVKVTKRKRPVNKRRKTRKAAIDRDWTHSQEMENDDEGTITARSDAKADGTNANLAHRRSSRVRHHTKLDDMMLYLSDHSISTTEEYEESSIMLAEVAAPKAEESIPTIAAKVPVPTAEVAVPAAEATLPTAEVTVPAAAITLPTAEVTVPTAEVTVSPSKPRRKPRKRRVGLKLERHPHESELDDLLLPYIRLSGEAPVSVLQHFLQIKLDRLDVSVAIVDTNVPDVYLVDDLPLEVVAGTNNPGPKHLFYRIRTTSS